MTELLTIDAALAFLALATLEIVLGIDNVVFISILVGKLPKSRRRQATQIGLLLAMAMRVALLAAISWVMGLEEELFAVFQKGFSGRDLILLGGGLFLIAKAVHEIHDNLEGGHDAHAAGSRAKSSFLGVLTQIALLDMVFSLDSVITAVGMADQIAIMVAAIVVAIIVMMLFAPAVGKFVENHPTTKMLALSFLLLIGVTLTIEGFGGHVEKGYIYFAMGFSVFVELLNLRMRKVRKPVRLTGKAEGYGKLGEMEG